MKRAVENLRLEPFVYTAAGVGAECRSLMESLQLALTKIMKLDVLIVPDSGDSSALSLATLALISQAHVHLDLYVLAWHLRH